MRVPRPRHQPRVPAPREHQLVAEVRVDGGEVCDPVIHRGRVPVRVKRAAEVLRVQPPGHAGPGRVVTRPVRGRAVLRPQDLVHAAEDGVTLAAGAEGGAGVDPGHAQPLLVMAVMRIRPGPRTSDLGVLSQLGEADELLVKAGVLLDLMSSARNLHFDSVLFLLLEEVVLPFLVIACKRRGMPRPGAEFAAHGGVRSPIVLRIALRMAGAQRMTHQAISTRRKLRESF